jgi:hypothetical protein
MRNEANTTHTAANCQSTRLGYRLSFVGEAQQPENLWVCVRDGGRRSVTDSDCEQCARWESSEDTAAAPRPVAGPVFLAPIWHA